MRTTEEWLDAYAESHRNPTNKLIHWICVPLIMFSLLGLLSYLRVPGTSTSLMWLNGASLLIVVALGFYFMLSWKLAVGMVFVSGAMLSGLYGLISLNLAPLWAICVSIFVVAWIFQFIGHKIEGAKPSFFEDIQFLLIGPLWLLSFVYERAGIKY